MHSLVDKKTKKDRRSNFLMATKVNLFVILLMVLAKLDELKAADVTCQFKFAANQPGTEVYYKTDLEYYDIQELTTEIVPKGRRFKLLCDYTKGYYAPPCTTANNILSSCDAECTGVDIEWGEGSCKIRECIVVNPARSHPVNASIGTKLAYGSKVEYECNPGYRTLSTTLPMKFVATCKRMWTMGTFFEDSEKNTDCSREITCDDPSATVGSASAEVKQRYKYGTNVTVVCHDGWFHNKTTSKFTLTCLDTPRLPSKLAWEPKGLKCDKRKCTISVPVGEKLSTLHYDVYLAHSSSQREKLSPGTTVEFLSDSQVIYQCVNQYSFDSKQTSIAVTCDQPNQDVDIKETCKSSTTCNILIPTGANYRAVGGATSVASGTQVIWQCERGFTFSDSSSSQTTTCAVDGKLDMPPSCTAVQKGSVQDDLEHKQTTKKDDEHVLPQKKGLRSGCGTYRACTHHVTVLTVGLLVIIFRWFI